jgi:hypothetical protein
MARASDKSDMGSFESIRERKRWGKIVSPLSFILAAGGATASDLELEVQVTTLSSGLTGVARRCGLNDRLDGNRLDGNSGIATTTILNDGLLASTTASECLRIVSHHRDCQSRQDHQREKTGHFVTFPKAMWICYPVPDPRAARTQYSTII